MNAIEINQKKVLQSKALLLEIIQSPSQFQSDEQLIKVLKSQGGLAKYENKERIIVACSLNTLKSASDSLLNRGFLELDELRINARNAIEGVQVDSQANSRTRTGLKHKIDELQAQVEHLQKSNFLLTTIIDELRGALKEQAFNSNDSTIIEKYREQNKHLEAKLSYTLNGKL
jgi:phenylalanyl-tRNA synthetase alpha subunit